MKAFINSIKKVEKTNTFQIILWTIIFSSLMLITYFYILNSKLGDAPEFIYNAF